MIVDLHEDISDYFLTAGATSVIQPFDEDVEGRHVDIPKYRKAGVRLVFGSIFPMVSGLNTRLIGKIERSEEHTSELQSRQYLVCRLLLEKKKKKKSTIAITT